MPQEILGQVAALLFGTTAPENLTLIWARTDNDDPETMKVLDFRIWDHNTLAWEPIARTGSLFHVASGAPTGGTGTDLDMYLNSTSLLLYKKLSGTWVQVANLASATPAVSGVLLAANNLSDLTDPVAARVVLDVPSTAEVDDLLAEKALKEYPVHEITTYPHTIPLDQANSIIYCPIDEGDHIVLDESSYQFPLGTEIIVVNNSAFNLAIDTTNVVLNPPTGYSATLDKGVAILRKVKVVNDADDIWTINGDIRAV
jgi:hypothetical protein